MAVGVSPPTWAAQFIIEGPAGSGRFGTEVVVLPSGNIVVTDPSFDAPGPILDVGAVYLYRPDGALIGALVGTSARDHVGGGGITVLSNGNYLVHSPLWDNGQSTDAGALTFGSGTSGVAGTVSAVNSLVGRSGFDGVGGFRSVTSLPNGNYIAVSHGWKNDRGVAVGSATFGHGVGGITGEVTPVNSLVGSSEFDFSSNFFVGESGVTVLPNGNYVVLTPLWDNGAATDAGAVTFGSGSTGVRGTISSAVSLTGSSANDLVGGSGVTVLSNGNYVVGSGRWDNGAIADAGAATFGSGSSGVNGNVTALNSLVGGSSEDRVGIHGATALTNGNYVVRSPDWDDGAVENVGAVTFGWGTAGISGVVSSANSLVGGTAEDSVGLSNVTALSNGNYVVIAWRWDHGTLEDAGAVTFGLGSTGISGIVSPANSLVGGSARDMVGDVGVTALSNGNYVVASRSWTNGNANNAGATTFGSGTTGIRGAVSPSNSLVGSNTNDSVGSGGVTALSNGDYVVVSPNWTVGAATSAGAVTFGPGSTGITGVVTSANSLVGGSFSDSIGSGGVRSLGNGSYVVCSPLWTNDGVLNAGAVTFGDANIGISGRPTAANSLVGRTFNEGVGAGCVTVLSDSKFLIRTVGWRNELSERVGAFTLASGTTGINGHVSQVNSIVGSRINDFIQTETVALTNGNFVIFSPFWTNGAAFAAGATTLGLSDGSVVGPISTTHSVVGQIEGAGQLQVFDYDPARNQLVVGQQASNRVVLHRTGTETTTQVILAVPNPSEAGKSVGFTANVGASTAAPTDGIVTFAASTGETCTDAEPEQSSSTTAAYSCHIVFMTTGVRSVVAEYTGSVANAYSRSAPESHTTIPESPVFADGFEDR